MKKTLSILMALLVLSLVPTSLFAQEPLFIATEAHTVLEAPNLANHQKQVLEGWVSYSHQSKPFTIKDGAEKAPSPDDFQPLNVSTNISLSNADFSTGKTILYKPGHEPNYFSYRNRSEGETKIGFHWWGHSVYSLKTIINNAEDAISVGGFLIPHKIASKLIQILDFGLGKVPSGISFDYNSINTEIGSNS